MSSPSTKFIAELVGTFIFVAVILFAIKTLSKSDNMSVVPLIVAIGLLAGIYVCMGAGGDAHLNPAVSTAFLAKGDITTKEFGYVVSGQIVGAILAFGLYKFMTRIQ